MILGAVLAGGAARRFGSDKALALLGGVPLLDHAIALLAGFADMVVVAGGERAGYQAIADRPARGLGPLGGLCGALFHARAHGFDAVLTAPCDAPGAPLAGLVAAGAPAYLAELPVAGLWPAALADALLAHLDGDDRSVRGWAERCGATPVRTDARLRNINRADDLRAAERDYHPQK